MALSDFKAQMETFRKIQFQIGKRFGEKFGESSEKVLELIFKDQYISASGIAQIVGISDRAIEKQLAKLKDKGIIKRIGPDKGGYWKINL